MSSSLTGTTALVTGASSGIGSATARRLAELGATVAVVARRQDRLDALAADIEQAGGTALVVVADISVRDQAEAAVRQVIERTGRLDIVVNNAGLMLLGPVVGADVEDWERMIATNQKALLYVTNAALPHLLTAADDDLRGVADLVNISSIAGRFANRNVAIYNATKFGVTAASESWRQEFAPMGVRVSVVEPGVVETELFGHQKQSVQEHYERLFADVEPLQASDLADVVAFIVTAPRRMAVAEVLVRPTDQA